MSKLSINLFTPSSRTTVEGEEPQRPRANARLNRRIFDPFRTRNLIDVTEETEHELNRLVDIESAGTWASTPYTVFAERRGLFIVSDAGAECEVVPK